MNRLSLPWKLAALVWCLCSTPAFSKEIKNVLFLISDDLKASVLGCYGDKICETPHIDKLASEGMVFNHAYCQATWCQPSRQSFMYSRYRGNKGTNFGEHFKNNGFFSARAGKIYHMRVPGDIIDGTDGGDVPSSWTEKYNLSGREAHTPGDYACLNLNIFTTEEEDRQSTRMPHRMFVTVQYDGDGSDQPDHKSASKAIELLQKHKDERFFLAVGFVRPHYPMVAPRQYFEKYDWEKIDLPEVIENDIRDIPKIGRPATMNSNNSIGKYPDNQKRMWEGYYASTTFMDDQVGRVINELERLGLRDSTAIVFTSDHGYHLGEHTFWQKSTMHEEVSRVPLIVSAPGFSAGRSDSFAELMDIYPTCSELAGLEIPDSVQGKSLVPILKNPQAKVRDAVLTLDSGFGLRSERWTLLKYNDGSEELYDMLNDPAQFHNLAPNPEYAQKLEENRKALSEKLKEFGLSFDRPKKAKSKK